MPQQRNPRQRQPATKRKAKPPAVPLVEPTIRVEGASRLQQKQATLERVRDAARELFIQNGYHETTAQAIAARAGVAKGTVFVHARDKLDLLMLVMHDRLERTVQERTATLPRSGLCRQLTHLFTGLYEMYGAHPNLSQAFLTLNFSARGPHSDALQALTLSFLQQLAELVRQAQQRREVSADVEPMLAVSNAFASYWMTLMAWTSGYLTLPEATASLGRALDLQMSGLR